MTLDNSSLFPGTLRSTLDTPPPLSDGFRHLESLWRETLAAYLAGKFTSEKAAQRFEKLRAFDQGGTEWTLGATSKAWYRKPPGASTWIISPPPPLSIGDPLPGPWSELKELTSEDFVEKPSQDFSNDVALEDANSVDSSISNYGTPIPDNTEVEPPYEDSDSISDYASFLEAEESDTNEGTDLTNAELDEAISRFLQGE